MKTYRNGFQVPTRNNLRQVQGTVRFYHKIVYEAVSFRETPGVAVVRAAARGECESDADETMNTIYPSAISIWEQH